MVYRGYLVGIRRGQFFKDSIPFSFVRRMGAIVINNGMAKQSVKPGNNAFAFSYGVSLFDGFEQ